MIPSLCLEALENRQMLSVAAPVAADVRPLIQPTITAKATQPKLVANTYFLGSPTLGGIAGTLALKIKTVSGTAVTASFYSMDWGGFNVAVIGTINSAGIISLTGKNTTCQVTAFKGSMGSTSKTISGSCTVVQKGFTLKGAITVTRTAAAPVLNAPLYQIANYLMLVDGTKAMLSGTTDGNAVTLASTVGQGPVLHGVKTVRLRWYSAAGVDMNQYFSQNQQGFHLQQVVNYESNVAHVYDFSSDFLQYPSQVAIGQSYISNNVAVTRSTSGRSWPEVRNEKLDVLGFESVTTAAGTFFCLEVQHTEDITSDYGSYHEVRTEWLARGIGMVKMKLAGKENGVATESGSLNLLSYTPAR